MNLRPESIDDLINLAAGPKNRNDVLLRMSRVLAGDRRSACERLGLDGELVAKAAFATYDSAIDAHLRAAPDGDSARAAAIADVFLAGLIVGNELR